MTLSEYEKELERQVVRALGFEELDFNSLLYKLKGAQQQAVQPVLKRLLSENTITLHQGRRYALLNPPPKPDWDQARALVINLLTSLPPGNPLAGQWWFNFDSAVDLAERVWHAHWGGPVVFLGTPVAFFAYAVATRQESTLLEGDADVVATVEEKIGKQGLSHQAKTLAYDAFDELPSGLGESFEAIVCDPPWYEDPMKAFLKRCLQAGHPRGTAYWSVAPLLTRVDAEKQRVAFLNRLSQLGCSLMALDSAALTYIIPEFEAEAYKHVRGFRSRVWRRSDLLTFRLPEDPAEKAKKLELEPRPDYLRARSYHNQQAGLRLFHLSSREKADSAKSFEEDPEFGKTVSLSGQPSDHIALWTSQRKGFVLSELAPLPAVLELWSAGNTRTQIQAQLGEGTDIDADVLSSTLELLSVATQTDEGSGRVIRRRFELEAYEKKVLDNGWATLDANRERPASFDPYRLEFQRDRDKVLWSKAFKRLASKTQVFPNFGDDRFRSRLTHTLEVTQIAKTLARGFGLNEDLTEAVALAHDIGHTPFGHAGEEAINDFLGDILNWNQRKDQVRTTWFSHYEHGVDVLRWLEDIYFSPGAGRAAGLGLSLEVYDGVFKHMYYRYQQTPGRKSKNKKSQEELYLYSKHRDILREGFTTLEGQSVRIADKVCYLVEDIEDGILAGVIHLNDLVQCRLFSRPFLDFGLAGGESELHRFLSQRGEIINILTKDVLENTQRVLEGLGSRVKVQDVQDYSVRPSDEMAEDISEVWTKVQAGILHKNHKVVGANARASRITRTLLLLATFSPDVVDQNFRSYLDFLHATPYYKNYEESVGSDTVLFPIELGSGFDAALAVDRDIEKTGAGYRVPLRNLIQSKDFVASLTDGQAMSLYSFYVQAGPQGT